MLKPITTLPPKDLELLRREVAYDPATGIFTRRSTGRVFGAKPSPNGYKMLDFRVAGRRFAMLQHRAAFFIMLGRAPKMIDHEDGDKANNRWKNIRPSNSSHNNLNRHVKVGRDQHLPVGVYERTRKGRPGVWFECKVSRFSTYRRNRQSAVDFVAEKRAALLSPVPADVDRSENPATRAAS